MNSNLSDALEMQISELRERVWRLEEALHAQGILVPTGPVPEIASGSAVPDEELPPQVVAEASAPLSPVPEAQGIHFSAFESPSSRAEASDSLESRIGSQWFNRVGIVAVLIGMAWFLKFAIDNYWIGPAGRVVIGLLAGAGFVAWSERFRARGYAAFSYSLKAVGSGTLYLSLWAAFQLYQLIPSGVAFVAMIAVTAFNGFMAWAQDSELLAVYAIAGCLSTPLLISTGGNHEITLFSYLLLMDLAVLVLVALKPWSRLFFGAFAGTVFFILGWSSGFYTPEQAWRTAFFVACFFLIFALAPRLVKIQSDENGSGLNWNVLALAVLPIANAALGFLAFYNLLDQPGADWFKPWLAIAFAAFYLFLLRLPANGFVRESTVLLSDLHLSAAVVFLTIALPLKAHGRWLTVGWLAEAAALAWVARRERSPLIQMLAAGCLILGLLALLLTHPAAALVPFFNQRFATYCVAIAVCTFTAWLAWQAHTRNEPEMLLPWQGVAVAMALLVNLLILLAVGFEIDAFWWHLHWQGHPEHLTDFQMYAQFTYSAWFMLYGAQLLVLGIGRKSAFLRWQALVLFAITIGKVFLVDISELSQGFRILSFLGLGALLLAVSFVYQKDILHLRAQKRDEEEV